MRKNRLYSLMMCLGGIFIGSLGVATSADVAKPCEVSASGDACVFDLQATADGLLQVDSKSGAEGERWRTTLAQTGARLAISHVGTGNTTDFTGRLSDVVVRGRHYGVVVSYEGPLPGNFPTRVTVRFVGPVTVSAQRPRLLQGAVSARPDPVATSAPSRPRPQRGDAAQPALTAPTRSKPTQVAGVIRPPSLLRCGPDRVNLGKRLLTIAQRLEGVPYTQKPPSALQDCSGMFHRVVQKFNDDCPGYVFPDHRADRQSIAIGKWYADRGLFTVITNPVRQAHLITEGSVMFYGHQRKRYTPKELSSPAEAIKRINHLGVVVRAVRKDQVVIQYHLFHGRRPGRTSKITNYHYRQPRSTPKYPYGNGAEQWIGMAPFVQDGPKQQ